MRWLPFPRYRGGFPSWLMARRQVRGPELQNEPVTVKEPGPVGGPLGEPHGWDEPLRRRGTQIVPPQAELQALGALAGEAQA